jgi:hypothetical protein
MRVGIRHPGVAHPVVQATADDAGTGSRIHIHKLVVAGHWQGFPVVVPVGQASESAGRVLILGDHGAAIR